MAKTGETVVLPEQELRERVARALAKVDRDDATQAREKALAEAVSYTHLTLPTNREV